MLYWEHGHCVKYKNIQINKLQNDDHIFPLLELDCRLQDGSLASKWCSLFISLFHLIANTLCRGLPDCQGPSLIPPIPSNEALTYGSEDAS
jgi:hypothetical protein